MCGRLLFEKLALEMLTALENWRTEDEHTDAKVAKYAFYFQTTAYCSVFLWGFVWSRAKVGGIDLGCGGGACYDYLMVKVPAFFFTVYFGGFLLRYLYRLVTQGSAAEPQVAESEDTLEGDAPAEDIEVEQQRPGGFESDSNRPKLAAWDVSSWYLSKLIEVGFVVLFSGVFPLLPLALLLIQVLEIRDRARYVLTGVQRPPHRCTKGLGTVNDFLDIQVTAGILAQCCVLAFGSDGLAYYLPRLQPADRILCAAVVEHLLLLFKMVWDSAAAEVPPEVISSYERRENEKEGILRELDHFDPMESVLFYTSDDGEAFYGK